MMGCAGSCNQGRAPCDCELMNGIPPDAERTFRPVARATSLWQTIIVGTVIFLTGASLSAFVIGAVFYTFRA